MLSELIIYNILILISAILGIFIYLRKNKQMHAIFHGFDSFAAGIFLGIVFFIIIPELTEIGINFGIYILSGFFLFYLLEHTITSHHCHDDECRTHRKGIANVIGIGFHSLVDGIIIGIAFLIAQALGIFTSIGIIIHTLPVTLVTIDQLIKAKVEKNKAILYTIIATSMIFIGSLISFFLLGDLNKSILGVLLAISAGIFIYIGASDLLPNTHQEYHKKDVLFFFIALVVMFFVSRIPVIG